MIKAEGKILGKEHNAPWSPALHDAVTAVSIWNHNNNVWYIDRSIIRK